MAGIVDDSDLISVRINNFYHQHVMLIPEVVSPNMITYMIKYNVKIIITKTTTTIIIYNSGDGDDDW